MSLPLPGASGTTIRTGRSGQAGWASPGVTGVTRVAGVARAASSGRRCMAVLPPARLLRRGARRNRGKNDLRIDREERGAGQRLVGPAIRPQRPAIPAMRRGPARQAAAGFEPAGAEPAGHAGKLTLPPRGAGRLRRCRQRQEEKEPPHGCSLGPAGLTAHEKGPGVATGALSQTRERRVYFIVTAWRPRWPSRTSSATFSPCCTSCLPARCSTEECRNTS